MTEADNLYVNLIGNPQKIDPIIYQLLKLKLFALTKKISEEGWEVTDLQVDRNDPEPFLAIGERVLQFTVVARMPWKKDEENDIDDLNVQPQQNASNPANPSGVRSRTTVNQQQS